MKIGDPKKVNYVGTPWPIMFLPAMIRADVIKLQKPKTMLAIGEESTEE